MNTNLIFNSNFNLLSLEERGYFLMLREISDECGRITSKVVLDNVIRLDLTPYAFEYSRDHVDEFPVTTGKLTSALFEAGFIEDDETGRYEFQIAKEYRK